MLTPAWHPLVFHPTRSAAALCQKRFVALPCGRGSGKSEIAKRKIVISLRDTTRPNGRYFYCGPTQEQTDRIAWDSLIALIPPSWILHPRDINISEGTIRTRFGSSVVVAGLDKPARIEGTQYDGGVCDESCDIKAGAFDRSIMPALLHRSGWCWRIGVPKRAGVGAREFRAWSDAGARGDIADRATFHWSGEDIYNILDPGKLAALKDSMTAKDYDEQIRANWQTAGGLAFYAYSSANLKPCTYNPALPVLVGCDFNVDPMAWVFGHLHSKGDFSWVEIFDELWIRNTNTREALDEAWNRYGTHRAGFRWFLDSSSNQRRTSAVSSDYVTIRNDDRFRQVGSVILFPQPTEAGTMEANPPVDMRMDACNGVLRAASGAIRLYISPRCRHLIDDLESRHYKPGTKILGDADDIGHISDALGYLVHSIFPPRIASSEGPSTITTRSYGA